MHQNRQLQFPFHSENNEAESVNSSNRQDTSFFDGHLLPAAFIYLKLIEPTACEGLIAPLNILKGAQLEMVQCFTPLFIYPSRQCKQDTA